MGCEAPSRARHKRFGGVPRDGQWETKKEDLEAASDQSVFRWPRIHAQASKVRALYPANGMQMKH